MLTAIKSQSLNSLPFLFLFILLMIPRNRQAQGPKVFSRPNYTFCIDCLTIHWHWRLLTKMLTKKRFSQRQNFVQKKRKQSALLQTYDFALPKLQLQKSKQHV